jgi:NAD(P)-dependent dehydrogenase (short-subunit alcohol dehydrogenase family)
MTLARRRILVTGAASGIGRGIAHALHAQGARVALLDRNGDGLRDAARALSSDVPYRIADVSRADDVSSAVAGLIDALGGLDSLVNCAGVDLLSSFDTTGEHDWQRLIGVNLMGPVNVCHAAVPALRDGTQPAIVNVASAAGLRPLQHRTAYCSSKAALVMFSKALAMDLAADGIRVNAICPGIVDTPMLDASVAHAADRQQAMADIASRYLIERAGTVEEIAATVAFLLDDGAGYITGSAIAVDGGRSFH